MKKLTIKLIELYQKTLSPDHGWFKHRHPFGYCKYSPTCSEYTRQSIEKYDIIKGGYLSIKRVIRCNPWSKGGIDPVV